MNTVSFLHLAAPAAIAAWVLVATAAAADPMRPLAAPATASASAAAPTFATAAVTAQPTLASDRLVAIRRNSDGRLQALIGEQWVGQGERVGGRSGNATLRALTDSSATLALGREQLVLHVLPPLLASGPETPAAERRRGATPIAAAQRSRPSPPSRSTPTP